MPKYFDPALVEDSLLRALKGEIKCGFNAANLPVGIVELSAFKFHYAVYIEPNDFLPDPERMLNIHMWDHLKGNLPKPVLMEIEMLISEKIAQLLSDGIVTFGGKVRDSNGTSVYPGTDWIVSQSIQA